MGRDKSLNALLFRETYRGK